MPNDLPFHRLAPVYNGGDLALVHRVGYPKQSRSHFDSQNYWETGNPNNNLVKDGILYVTEDRKVNGFFETMTVGENIYLGDLARPRRFPLLVSRSRL